MLDGTPPSEKEIKVFLQNHLDPQLVKKILDDQLTNKQVSVSLSVKEWSIVCGLLERHLSQISPGTLAENLRAKKAFNAAGSVMDQVHLKTCVEGSNVLIQNPLLPLEPLNN